MKYIEIKSFGNRTFINTQYIESVIEIDGKTRICPAGGDGYYELDEPIEDIMARIEATT